jgi:hypothetical protein
MNRWCQSVNDPLNCLGRLSNTTLSLIDDSDNLIVSKTIGDTCGQLTLEYVFEAALQFCQKISTMVRVVSIVYVILVYWNLTHDSSLMSVGSCVSFTAASPGSF